jgi:sarcosine oxidase delta subunit
MVKCPWCGRRTESENITVNPEGFPDIRDWQDDGSLVVFFEEEV